MSKNNLEKESNNLIIILLLAISLICSLGYIAYDKYFDKIVVPKEEKEENTQTIEYNKDGYFVKELMNNIIIHNGYSHIEYQLYSKDKVTSSDLATSYRDSLVLSYMLNVEHIYNNFTKEELDNTSKRLFGKSLYNTAPDTISGNCKTYKYTENPGGTSTYLDQVVGGCGGAGYLYSDKITKTESDENHIYVYQKVAFLTIADPSSSEYKESIYKTINYKEDGKYEYEELIDTVNGSIKIDDYLDKLNEYKFTFTYDNDNNTYYFESVELVK